MAGGRPKMLCLTGIPEMTFISSSLRPSCCNFSTPCEAGSISSNMARSVIDSDITEPLFIQGHLELKLQPCQPCESCEHPGPLALPRLGLKELIEKPAYITAGTKQTYLLSSGLRC